MPQINFLVSDSGSLNQRLPTESCSTRFPSYPTYGCDLHRDSHKEALWSKESSRVHPLPNGEDDNHFSNTSSDDAGLCINTLELPSPATIKGFLYWFWSNCLLSDLSAPDLWCSKDQFYIPSTLASLPSLVQTGVLQVIGTWAVNTLGSVVLCNLSRPPPAEL